MGLLKIGEVFGAGPLYVGMADEWQDIVRVMPNLPVPSFRLWFALVFMPKERALPNVVGRARFCEGEDALPVVGVQFARAVTGVAASDFFHRFIR